MKSVSNSEFKILQLFWKNKNLILKKEIFHTIQAAYPNEWKNSSISVFLMRLEEKKFISKHIINGTLYWKSISKSEYLKAYLNNILLKHENKTYTDILLGFIDDEQTRNEAANEIDELIKKYADAE
ncbi:MAG: BlaI/MecI/CopY family transcriptional regulator [Erysipelotrichaceae bacterium]|nr:BlaI/MecI/CopY family transcriptional regulator [Erysipelotrichaceae bacterium]MDY5251113.1 BlaI/MecI/CopY family transcriptional regulator [Erysipelotrichaceae bacterium]